VTDGEPDPAAFLGLAPGALVLDMAAGKGRAAAALLAAGARAVLLERDAAALAAAAESLGGPASFVRGDVHALPFDAAVFDAVVLRAVVHHLVEPVKALREAARVAKPGAAVLVVDKVGPEDHAARAFRNAVERLRHPGHVWSWSERELKTLAGAAHLDVEAWRPWTEERDAEEWIARGDCPAPWDRRVHEYLRADLRAGGAAFGVRVGVGGSLSLEERWGALRLRKPGSRR
jgi:SAM-dependent methyltransferase